MINLSEIVKEWPEVKGWRVCPADTGFCKAGTRLIVGNNSWIGNNARIGNSSEIGNNSRIGNSSEIGSYSQIGNNSAIGSYSQIGNGSVIGNNSAIGSYSQIGNGSEIGSYSQIGNGSRIGSYSTSAIDIGFADGYRKCVAEVKGVAYIGAGCRWFTLDAAIAHWSNHEENRDMTMCLLESAQAIARIKGWSFS